MQRLVFKTLGVQPGCAHMHITRMAGRQASAPHAQDFYEFFLVLEGAGMHHLNRRKIPLQAGHLMLIRPPDTHWFSTERGQHLVFVNVAVSAAWWRAFHTTLGLPAGNENPRAVLLGASDTQRLGAELGGAGVMQDPWMLVRAWDRARGHLTLPARESADEPPAWLLSLRRELASSPEALGEPIAYWQRRSARSPEHLARSCRRFYGVTFSELINQARVERARYLLRTTDEKVITIAFDCGYKNLANFHRVFARLTGRTPSHWRRAGHAAVPLHVAPARQ